MADFFIRVKVDPSGAVAGNRAVQGSLATTEARAKSLQATLIKTFALFGAAAGVGAGIRLLADFSQEMSTVAAITGATDYEFRQLEETAKQLGATTRFTASEAAQGMVLLSRAGFTAAETMDTVDDTLKLAQAGALDLASAADITAKTIKGFRLETDQASRVVDVLALAANTSNTNVGQLGEAIKFVAPVAAGLSVSLEETVAAITALSDAGLQATLAGTGLRRVMAELESVGGPAADILRDLGIEEENVQVSTVGLVAALQQMKSAGIDTGKALEFFGQRGGPAFEVLQSNIPHIQEAIEALREAGGTADEIARIMDDNLNGALLRTKSAFEAVILEMGELGAQEDLKQFFEDFAGGLRALARNLDNVVTTVKALGVVMLITFSPQIMGKAVVLTKGLSKAILGLSKSMQVLSISSVSSLRFSVLRLIVAFKSLGAVIAANPLLLGGAAVVGAAVIGIDILNQKMTEAERAQDAAHAKALSLIRARLKQIQTEKAVREEIEKQNVAVTNFLATLDQENKLLRLNEAEREVRVAIMQAEEEAGRPLREAEAEAVRNLIAEKQAIEANNDLMAERAELLKSIKGPAQDLARLTEHLNVLLEQGDITQAEYNAKLKELEEQYKSIEDIALELPSFESTVAGLDQQLALLKLTNEEREVQNQLLAIQKSIEGGLSDTQSAAVQTKLEQVQALQLYNELIQSTITPLEEMRRQEEALKLLLDAKIITVEQYREALAALAQQSQDTGTDLSSGFARGLDTIKTEIQDLSAISERLVTTAFRGATDAIVDFVTTGEANIQQFVQQVLAELTRLLLMKALLSFIPGIGPAAGAAAPALGGAQHGASFKVGGSGGTDSQLVAFRATPGEKVDVQTPGQQRASAMEQKAPEVNVRSVTVFDPKLALDAIDTVQGERLVVNIIQRNKTAVRKSLG